MTEENRIKVIAGVITITSIVAVAAFFIFFSRAGQKAKTSTKTLRPETPVLSRNNAGAPEKSKAGQAGIESLFTENEPDIFSNLKTKEESSSFTEDLFDLADILDGSSQSTLRSTLEGILGQFRNTTVTPQISDQEVFHELYPDYYLKALDQLQNQLIQNNFLNEKDRVSLTNEEAVFEALKKQLEVLYNQEIISKEQLRWSRFTLRKEFWQDKRNEEIEVRQKLLQKKLQNSLLYNPRYKSLAFSSPSPSLIIDARIKINSLRPSLATAFKKEKPAGAVTLPPWDSIGVISFLFSVKTTQAETPSETTLGQIAGEIEHSAEEHARLSSTIESQGLNQSSLEEMAEIHKDIDTGMRGLILIKDNLADASNPAGVVTNLGRVASSLQGIMSSQQKIAQTIKDPSIGNIISSGSSIISSIKDIKSMLDSVTNASAAAERFPGLAGALGLLGNSVGGTSGTIIGIAGKVLNLDIDDITDTIEGIEDFLDINLDGIKDLLGDLGGMLDDIKGALDDLVGGFKDAIDGLLGDLGLKDLLGSLSDMFGGLNPLSGLLGDTVGGLLGNAIPISGIGGKDCYRQGGGAGGGADLAAAFCNSGWDCIPTPAGCAWRWVDDCGDPDVICEIKLGCKNLICPGRPMIWDPLTRICGCSGGGGGIGSGSGSGNAAASGNTQEEFSLPSVAKTSDNEFTFFSAGNNSVGSTQLSADGTNWEVYAPDGTLFDKIPVDNVSTFNSTIYDSQGNATGVISANDQGFNVYGPDSSTLIGTVRNEPWYNAHTLYDNQGNIDASIINKSEFTEQILNTDQGFFGSNLGRELLVRNDVQPPPFFEADGSGIIFFDPALSSSNQAVMRDNIVAAREAFNPDHVAHIQVAVASRDQMGEIAYQMSEPNLTNAQQELLRNNPEALIKLKTELGNGFGGVVSTDVRTNDVQTIFINQRFMDNQTFPANQVSLMQNPTEVVVHEYGHPVYENLPLDQQNKWANIYSRVESCQCVSAPPYIFENAHEGFAETLVAYHRSGGSVSSSPIKPLNAEGELILRDMYGFVKENKIFK